MFSTVTCECHFGPSRWFCEWRRGICFCSPCCVQPFIEVSQCPCGMQAAVASGCWQVASGRLAWPRRRSLQSQAGRKIRGERGDFLCREKQGAFECLQRLTWDFSRRDVSRKVSPPGDWQPGNSGSEGHLRRCAELRKKSGRGPSGTTSSLSQILAAGSGRPTSPRSKNIALYYTGTSSERFQRSMFAQGLGEAIVDPPCCDFGTSHGPAEARRDSGHREPS